MQGSDSAPAAHAKANTAENVEQSIRVDARKRLRQCKRLLEVAGLSSYYPVIRDSGVMGRFLAVNYTHLDDVLDDADDIVFSLKASDSLAASSSLSNLEENPTSTNSRAELVSRPPWRVAERLQFEKAVQTMAKSALQVNRVSISLAFNIDHSRRRSSHNASSVSRLWGEVHDDNDFDGDRGRSDRESKRESESEEVCDFKEALADSMAIDVFTKKYFKDISSTSVTIPVSTSSSSNTSSIIGEAQSSSNMEYDLSSHVGVQTEETSSSSSSSKLLTISAYGPRAEATARLVQIECPVVASTRDERDVDSTTQGSNHSDSRMQSPTDTPVTPLGSIQTLPGNPLHLSSEAINSNSNSNNTPGNSSSTTPGSTASNLSPSGQEAPSPRARRRQSLDSFPRLQRLIDDNFSTTSNSTSRISSVDSRDRSATISNLSGNDDSTQSSTSSRRGSDRRSSFGNGSVVSPGALDKIRPLRKAASKLTGRRGTFSGKLPDAVVAAEISGTGGSAEAQAEALRAAGEALGAAHGTLTVRVTGPRLGLTLDNQEGTGRLIAGFVQPNAVAWRAGLRSGDVIESVDGDVSFSTLDAVLATIVLRDKVNGSFGNVAGTVMFTVSRPPPLLDAGYAVVLTGKPPSQSQGSQQQQQHLQTAPMASAAEAAPRANAGAASLQGNFVSATAPTSGWQSRSPAQNAAAASHGAPHSNRVLDDDDDEEELLAAVIAEIEEEEKQEALRNGQLHYQAEATDVHNSGGNEHAVYGRSVAHSTGSTAEAEAAPVTTLGLSNGLSSHDDRKDYGHDSSDDESYASSSSLPSPLSLPCLTSATAPKNSSATPPEEGPFVIGFATSLGLEVLLPRLMALGVMSEQDVADSYMFTDQELFEDDEFAEAVEPWQRGLFRDASAELLQNQSSLNALTPEGAAAHASAMASFGAAAHAIAAGKPTEAQRHAQAGRAFEEASRAYEEEARGFSCATEVENKNEATEQSQPHEKFTGIEEGCNNGEVAAWLGEAGSDDASSADQSKVTSSETIYSDVEQRTNHATSIPIECANTSELDSSKELAGDVKAELVRSGTGAVNLEESASVATFLDESGGNGVGTNDVS